MKYHYQTKYLVKGIISFCGLEGKPTQAYPHDNGEGLCSECRRLYNEWLLNRSKMKIT